ncbi:MAG TPA: hypothetical protein VFM28_06995, partial [Nitrososphaeraceae archaeon]|nr:hypothetical protein [Nitrososphaeraceae archaeon]
KNLDLIPFNGSKNETDSIQIEIYRIKIDRSKIMVMLNICYNECICYLVLTVVCGIQIILDHHHTKRNF